MLLVWHAAGPKFWRGRRMTVQAVAEAAHGSWSTARRHLLRLHPVGLVEIVPLGSPCRHERRTKHAYRGVCSPNRWWQIDRRGVKGYFTKKAQSTHGCLFSLRGIVRSPISRDGAWQPGERTGRQSCRLQKSHCPTHVPNEGGKHRSGSSKEDDGSVRISSNHVVQAVELCGGDRIHPRTMKPG
jgi:hypothetical protein